MLLVTSEEPEGMDAFFFLTKQGTSSGKADFLGSCRAGCETETKRTQLGVDMCLEFEDTGFRRSSHKTRPFKQHQNRLLVIQNSLKLICLDALSYPPPCVPGRGLLEGRQQLKPAGCSELNRSRQYMYATVTVSARDSRAMDMGLSNST